ncbi:TonB-dependent receptor [Glaesserella parasuis]|uniref:TonB-dependent receptor domain-containing protein n=1 Tax=Glaesserella parasuis TaxID=738 RepID=UPI0004042C39|nr:TonB-dependent receptor [Glaesserella parasuis]MDG6336736.1 TonB-dependent receptor [Glaesserella parasuis]MDG6349913.1 TonB-dependent receptor [Glaesserella parasuis]MDO9646913.1 TonB-dependent receptor [Glaesserella parasuis]MDO9742400.1 TonB-dependent receptor [Glaesserella parasuis]MDO9755447.1 TonB-dependent receptor [Glaesserella parasuis]
MSNIAFRMSLITLAITSGAAYANTLVLDTVEVKEKNTIIADDAKIQNLRELFANKTEVGVGGGSDSAQYLSIRSAGQNRVNLVVDNTETGTQLWYHQGRFQFDPVMMKNIRVDKGAGSASAGIGKTSGAIRAETVDAKDLLKEGNAFGARVGTTYNSNKGIRGNLSVYGYHQGLDVLATGSWVDNKNYKGGKGYINGVSKTNEAINTARQQANYLAKVGYDINENHHIGFSFRQEHYYGDSAERPEFAHWVSPGPIEDTQRTYNLNYTGTNLGFIRDLDANLFYIHLKDERLAYEQGQRNTNFIQGERVSQTHTKGANLNFTSPLFSEHLLKYGINLRNESVESQNQRRGGLKGESKKEYGLYLEAIWAIQKVTLTTGVRYDHFSLNTLGKPNSTKIHASEGKVNPSLNVIWDITSNLALKTKLNYASRSPALATANTITDNRENLAQVRGRRDVDSNLKPEQSRLAEVGFEWKHSGARLVASLFDEKVTNYYSGVTAPTITNLGNLRTRGYDAEASYEIAGLKVGVGASYSRATPEGFKLSGDVLDIVPKGRQWKTTLSYTFENPNLEIGYRGRYAEAKTFLITTRSGDERIRKAGYGVHDIYANLRLLKDDLSLDFAINNIGNKRYQSHSQRLHSHINPGRQYIIGANYRF